MNYIKHLTGFLNKVVDDYELNPTHISLYLALFHSWNINRFENPISITRNEMMRISKIFSKATYHKCVNELHQKGYIIYEPSNNPFKGSLIWVIALDSAIVPQTKKEQRSSKNRQVSVQPIEPVTEQVLNKQQTSTWPTPRQALVSSINSINNTNNINNLKSVNGHAHKKNENKSNENLLEEQKKVVKKKLREKKEIGEIIPPNLEDVKVYFMNLDSVENEAERFYNHFQSNGWLVGGKSKMKNWQASARNWIMNAQSFNTIQANATAPVPGNLNTSKTKLYDEPL